MQKGLIFAHFTSDNEITIFHHISFRCTSCGLCCKLNQIPVTDKDIDRMDENGVETFQALESLSPVLIPSKNVKGNFIKAYILRKKPFTNECAFLMERNLCKIHEFKPLSCSIYPFALRKASDDVVEAIIHPNCVCKAIKVNVPEKKSQSKKIAEDLIKLLPLEEVNNGV